MGALRDPVVTSRIMAAVKGRDTEPERLLRCELFRMGLRYRLHGKGLPGRPDIVFKRARVAVFVDGDFFHGGGWKARGFASFEEQFSRWRNPAFWMEKIRSNVARDKKATAELRRLGWKVIRIWESDVRKSPRRAAATVMRAVSGR
jgi:DNA mismatch endonuclease (patch repair protein)